MAKKIKKLANPVVTEADEGGLSLKLPPAIRKNREVMRWLSHWVVDAVADYGHVDWMAGPVEARLDCLSADIVSTSVAHLIRQAIEATSEPTESQPPKRAKKRKRKGK